jgi:hypothetical protein
MARQPCSVHLNRHRSKEISFPRLSSTHASICIILQYISEFSWGFPMEKTDEKKQIGREIKHYLAVNRFSREEFCKQAKLGKSTVDKLITGIFSDSTLQIVLERTSFVRSNSYAAKRLGGYARAAWSRYLGTYLLLTPSLSGGGSIEAYCGIIGWDEHVPGLTFTYGRDAKGAKEPLGLITIPHERSPLIHVQAAEGHGRTLILSTMVGERALRGMIMSVSNTVANTYIPFARPIVVLQLEQEEISKTKFGTITSEDTCFRKCRSELRKVFEKQYALVVSADGFVETEQQRTVKVAK